MTLSETYDFLDELMALDGRIRRMQIQCSELRSCLFPSGVRYDSARVQSSPRDRMPESIARIDELNRQIETLQKKQGAWRLWLRIAIEQLPREKEKAVLTKYYLGHRSMREIADELCCSASTVYGVRRRGVLHLGEIFSDKR